MSRDDCNFAIYYSYTLERMNYTLLTRIDKLITLVLIVVGFSVFSSFNNYFVFGVFVSVLSVLQLVYHFGQEAGSSKEQMKQYKRLLAESPSLSDSELTERFAKAQDADNNPWRSLESAAYLKTCLYYGLPAKYNLTLMQICMSWLAGDLPHKKDFEDENEQREA
ncbi:hypothetical protein [Leclercia adecarboxylata]|uniref:hypothetical protein n=1 Tax=Leclercia adecarboxylata TaxID=83655 RepID=UPI0011DFB51F|nr:hypothetical protein [Leclercia adecarboxylata]NEG91053.1 hypothetical protein [Leclercia adecarboxylata]